MGFKQEIVIDPASGSGVFVVTLEGVMDMNRVLGDRLTEVVSEGPIMGSHELDNLLKNVEKDFERLTKDIESLVKMRQKVQIERERELVKLLNTLKYVKTEIMQDHQLVNEHYLREFERRGIRRDLILLGLAIGIPILITLLLHFFC